MILLDNQSKLVPGNAVAALLINEDGECLMQLRDPIASIFYPDHWGCFGGGLEPHDANLESGLQRELYEEIGIKFNVERFAKFTSFTFDLQFCGREIIDRTYYCIKISDRETKALVLGEGAEMAFFSYENLIAQSKVVPYDAYAAWLYYSQDRLKDD